VRGDFSPETRLGTLEGRKLYILTVKANLQSDLIQLGWLLALFAWFVLISVLEKSTVVLKHRLMAGTLGRDGMSILQMRACPTLVEHGTHVM
jgi:hypothetical protein